MGGCEALRMSGIETYPGRRWCYADRRPARPHRKKGVGGYLGSGGVPSDPPCRQVVVVSRQEIYLSIRHGRGRQGTGDGNQDSNLSRANGLFRS